ncbi:uncharacterized protein K452DRAFT_98404 [Aplosporella prunicola CBS 121167]|uniref:Uncharacterized protein n=1 Tax=Aplosporella prunicola CBS 121167 TaxID=1176127 RepID=A0A6A6B0U1_9PEZI|nr:uncharacterized protein K452DRAFT_98404 [Aplosporella prunicola CBS 121167]KAF2137789.1 hypothetical protein K452DRAFT_98404 [Aplosporella prunicola CBS 121167]
MTCDDTASTALTNKAQVTVLISDVLVQVNALPRPRAIHALQIGNHDAAINNLPALGSTAKVARLAAVDPAEAAVVIGDVDIEINARLAVVVAAGVALGDQEAVVAVAPEAGATRAHVEVAAAAAGAAAAVVLLHGLLLVVLRLLVLLLLLLLELLLLHLLLPPAQLLLLLPPFLLLLVLLVVRVRERGTAQRNAHGAHRAVRHHLLPALAVGVGAALALAVVVRAVRALVFLAVPPDRVAVHPLEVPGAPLLAFADNDVVRAERLAVDLVGVDRVYVQRVRRHGPVRRLRVPRRRQLLLVGDLRLHAGDAAGEDDARVDGRCRHGAGVQVAAHRVGLTVDGALAVIDDGRRVVSHDGGGVGVSDG